MSGPGAHGGRRWCTRVFVFMGHISRALGLLCMAHWQLQPFDLLEIFSFIQEMASTSDKVGHALAKGLLIKTDYRKDATTESLSRGESVFSTSNAETYIEKEPTAADYFREIAPNGQTVKRYFRDLFPFLNWITRYNLQWFTGDLIAGKFHTQSQTSFATRMSRSWVVPHILVAC